MNKKTLIDLGIFIMLGLTLILLVLGMYKLTQDGARCVRNPLGFYEQETNTTLPFLHPQGQRLPSEIIGPIVFNNSKVAGS